MHFMTRILSPKKLMFSGYRLKKWETMWLFVNQEPLSVTQHLGPNPKGTNFMCNATIAITPICGKWLDFYFCHQKPKRKLELAWISSNQVFRIERARLANFSSFVTRISSISTSLKNSLTASSFSAPFMFSAASKTKFLMAKHFGRVARSQYHCHLMRKDKFCNRSSWLEIPPAKNFSMRIKRS